MRQVSTGGILLAVEEKQMDWDCLVGKMGLIRRSLETLEIISATKKPNFRREGKGGRCHMYDEIEICFVP